MLRGVNRQPVFETKSDYTSFLEYLEEAKQSGGCHVLAYCLMPNHIHLLLEEGSSSVSSMVHRFAGRYAGRFNRVHNRVGHLFQDRFRSKPVEEDGYLLMVLLYIHFNPVVAGLCDNPGQFRWSSRASLPAGSSLVDVDRIERLLPVATLLEQEKTYDPVPDPPGVLTYQDLSMHPTDHDIWVAIHRMSGVSTKPGFERLPPDRQEAVVRALRQDGISVRHVSRLTGLPQTRVYRWGKLSENGE